MMVIETSAWHIAGHATGEMKVATLESLQAKIKKLEQQAEALIAKQSSAVIEKIRDLMATHGLTIADLNVQADASRLTPKSKRNAIVGAAMSGAKYRDPKTGATWSGRGRAPGWIAGAKNRDRFLVNEGAPIVNVASISKDKGAGNYVRGPQPAMYRDPKSGATWSGRGRAPAWIADVKDRSKFLIPSASKASVATAVLAPDGKSVSKKAYKNAKVKSGKGKRGSSTVFPILAHLATLVPTKSNGGRYRGHTGWTEAN